MAAPAAAVAAATWVVVKVLEAAVGAPAARGIWRMERRMRYSSTHGWCTMSSTVGRSSGFLRRAEEQW
jgi:hypothetical protein